VAGALQKSAQKEQNFLVIYFPVEQGGTVEQR
jgi:hypothetical protein